MKPMQPLQPPIEPMPGALRFAFVTTFYPPHHFGGDAVAVRLHAESLARRGHQVDVVYDLDPVLALQPDADPDPPDLGGGVRVHRLRSRLGVLSAIATHQTGRPVVQARRLRRLLEVGPDVIHFHNVSLVGGPGILAYGSAIKLYTAHEHWLICPTHVLWRHRREPCVERQCLRCLLHYRRPPQLWRWTGAVDRAAREVDVFCSPSRFSIDKHAAMGFAHPMRLLPPFLPDDPAPESGPREEVGKPPVFLFVGRLDRMKGLDDVIPLFTGERAPGELWIAGRGEHEGALRDLAGAAPAVRFLGWVDPPRVRSLLRAARALIVPSQGFEVFGMVLLEAFRDATPVIARRRGALIEVVEAAGGGLLFDDPAELRSAIERLAADPALARELGARARAAFVENWSEELFMRRYLGMIAEIAARRGRSDVLDRLGRNVANGAGLPGSLPEGGGKLRPYTEQRSHF